MSIDHHALPALTPSAIVVEQDQPRLPARLSAPERGMATTLVRWLAALALVMINILLFMLILLVAALPSPMSQLGSGLQGLAATPDRLAQTITAGSAALRQELVDRLDPSHPPRHPIAYDVEFSNWSRVGIGGAVVASSQNQLTLVDVRRRADAVGREQSYYAVVRQQQSEVRVTTLFGIPLHRESGQVERVLYQGESFVVGDAAYKVNWVGNDPGEIAVAQYRRREDVPATLKFTTP